MTYFAIRHKPSGCLMPQADTRRGGFTHDEPSDPSVRAPRLFTKKGAAQCALTWWLKGETSVTYSCSWEGESDEDWRTRPDPSRVAADMEVIPAFVVIPE